MDIAKARQYVTGLDLRGVRRGVVALSAQEDAGTVFDKAKDQAQVVGSGLFSFAKGVDDAMREAISDSALLAQLVADKRASLETDPLGWFSQYGEVLKNVGWVLQDFGLNDYQASGQDFEVNEQLIGVLTVALGPSPAALAVIKALMDALKAMNPSSPWLTLFTHEAQTARIARFQIGVAEPDAAGGAFVTMLACLLEAKTSLTQVLFFKFKEADVKLRSNAQKISLDAAALQDLGPVIRAKVRAYQHEYLSSIKDI